MPNYRSVVSAILGTAALAWGAPALSQTMGVSQSVRQEISALIASEDKAWNVGDARAFTAKALPDVVFTNIIGMFSVGKAPFLAQHSRIFATIYKGSVNHQEIQNITLLKPDVAIVDTIAVLTKTKAAPPGVQMINGAIRTRLEQVLVHRPDGWWVASFHNVAINPAAIASLPPSPKAK